jgi:carbon-monoxide dehydrogenase large subunit
VAADAVELVQPDIDPLATVVTFADALAEGAPLVHDVVPGNVYFLGRRTYGDPSAAFKRADLVVEAEVTHPRVAAAPIEPRGVVAARSRSASESNAGACAWWPPTSAAGSASKPRSIRRRSCSPGSRAE